MCDDYKIVTWMKLIVHGFGITCRQIGKLHIITSIQLLAFLTHNFYNQNPTNWVSTYPCLTSPLQLNCHRHRAVPTPPNAELRRPGQSNCMLKRLRNKPPVLLSWCFLCSLIVGMCSHAALSVIVSVSCWVRGGSDEGNISLQDQTLWL